MKSRTANIYLFNVNENTRKMCETSSKLATKTSEWRQCRCFGVFNVNFEQISHIVLTFPLLFLHE